MHRLDESSQLTSSRSDESDEDELVQGSTRPHTNTTSPVTNENRGGPLHRRDRFQAGSRESSLNTPSFETHSSELPAPALLTTVVPSSQAPQITMQGEGTAKREHYANIERFLLQDQQNFAPNQRKLSDLRSYLGRQIIDAVEQLSKSLMVQSPQDPQLLVHCYNDTVPVLADALAAPRFFGLCQLIYGAPSAYVICRRFEASRLTTKEFLRVLLGAAVYEWIMLERCGELPPKYNGQKELAEVFGKCKLKNKLCWNKWLTSVFSQYGQHCTSKPSLQPSKLSWRKNTSIENAR